MKEELLKMLREKSYRKGEFKLSSGEISEHYVNCKPVILSPEGLRLTSYSMLEYIESDSVSVAGLTLGADPLVCGVSLVSLESAWCTTQSALIVRKQAKGHGTGAWIEGPQPLEGSKVTVLEDVVTTGGSSLKAVEKLRDAGYVVETIVAIIDRQEGGKEAMEKSGITLKSLFTIEDFVKENQK